MQLNSCKKTYNNETQRAVPLEETLARIEPKVPAAGITRVADITNLDRIGIPVFSCIRPTAEDGAITVYNGKGATVEESRISAIMEGHRAVFGRGARPGYPGRPVPGTGRPRARHQSRGPDPAGRCRTRIGSCPGTRGTILSITRRCGSRPLRYSTRFPPRYRGLFRTNTNGLASGNTIEEAIFHALSEVIERDAWSLVESTRNTGPAVVGIDDPVIRTCRRNLPMHRSRSRSRDITSDIGIPTIAAVADDVLLKDPSLLTIGIGTHTSARIAVMRALTEVAQSRLTQIHGAREDTTLADLRKKMGYERAKRINGYWYRDNGTVDYAKISLHQIPMIS